MSVALDVGRLDVAAVHVALNLLNVLFMVLECVAMYDDPYCDCDGLTYCVCHCVYRHSVLTPCTGAVLQLEASTVVVECVAV